MNKINATIIADSIDCNGNRLISYIITVPQIIVKELLRHRMFSFSSSSMRAIPFLKTLQDIKENMFIPLAFQKHHNGMQGNDYLQDLDFEIAKKKWIEIGLKTCNEAEQLYNLGITKQICSRIIEPFGYAKILVTATEYDNFFELRCPKYHITMNENVEKTDNEVTVYTSKVNVYNSWKDACKDLSSLNPNEDFLTKIKSSVSGAEIHIQALAEAMWDARNESTPKQLKPGEWHIPFHEEISEQKIKDFKLLSLVLPYKTEEEKKQRIWELYIKIATARCARLSYMTHDGVIDYKKDIALHDQLLSMSHFSPFEHCAKAMNQEEYENFLKGGPTTKLQDAEGWCNNLRGFIPYRYMIENK